MDQVCGAHFLDFCTRLLHATCDYPRPLIIGRVLLPNLPKTLSVSDGRGREGMRGARRMGWMECECACERERETSQTLVCRGSVHNTDANTRNTRLAWAAAAAAARVDQTNLSQWLATRREVCWLGASRSLPLPSPPSLVIFYLSCADGGWVGGHGGCLVCVVVESLFRPST